MSSHRADSGEDLLGGFLLDPRSSPGPGLVSLRAFSSDWVLNHCCCADPTSMDNNTPRNGNGLSACRSLDQEAVPSYLEGTSLTSHLPKFIHLLHPEPIPVITSMSLLAQTYIPEPITGKEGGITVIELDTVGLPTAVTQPLTCHCVGGSGVKPVLSRRLQCSPIKRELSRCCLHGSYMST